MRLHKRSRVDARGEGRRGESQHNRESAAQVVRDSHEGQPSQKLEDAMRGPLVNLS